MELKRLVLYHWENYLKYNWNQLADKDPMVQNDSIHVHPSQVVWFSYSVEHKELYPH